MAFPSGTRYVHFERLRFQLNFSYLEGADGKFVCDYHCQWSLNQTLVDDGSGSVTILEAYRALLAADYRPIRTTEFHWYSAEVHSTLEESKPL